MPTRRSSARSTITSRACALLYGVADYIAINVSSPNTLGLRELQAAERAGAASSSALQEERRRLACRHGRRVPLLVKISPDSRRRRICWRCAAQLRDLGIDGVIATNTSTDLAGLG